MGWHHCFWVLWISLGSVSLHLVSVQLSSYREEYVPCLLHWSPFLVSFSSSLLPLFIFFCLFVSLVGLADAGAFFTGVFRKKWSYGQPVWRLFLWVRVVEVSLLSLHPLSQLLLLKLFHHVSLVVPSSLLLLPFLPFWSFQVKLFLCVLWFSVGMELSGSTMWFTLDLAAICFIHTILDM